MINDVSIGTIGRNLSGTLEELSLYYDEEKISFEGLLELKSMPKLKILNLEGFQINDEHSSSIAEYLKHQLLHLTLRIGGLEIIRSRHWPPAFP